LILDTCLPGVAESEAWLRVQIKSIHETVAVVTISFVSTFLNRRISNVEVTPS